MARSEVKRAIFYPISGASGIPSGFYVWPFGWRTTAAIVLLVALSLLGFIWPKTVVIRPDAVSAVVSIALVTSLIYATLGGFIFVSIQATGHMISRLSTAIGFVLTLTLFLFCGYVTATKSVPILTTFVSSQTLREVVEVESFRSAGRDGACSGTVLKRVRIDALSSNFVIALLNQPWPTEVLCSDYTAALNFRGAGSRDDRQLMIEGTGNAIALRDIRPVVSMDVVQGVIEIFTEAR